MYDQEDERDDADGGEGVRRYKVDVIHLATSAPQSLLNRELMRAPNPLIFLDIGVGEGAANFGGQQQVAHLGKMVFELFADLVPEAVECFRSLCRGEESRGRLPFKDI